MGLVRGADTPLTLYIENAMKKSGVRNLIALMCFLVSMGGFHVSAYAMTVVLDPGHGGAGTSHSGAIYQPFVEKDLNLDVAARVRDELADAGVTVYMTRYGEESPSLEERADYAASMNADLFISIHFNSSGPHDKFGSEVWTSLYDPYRSIGGNVGKRVLKNLNELGFANKGVKVKSGTSGDYYGIIRHGTGHGIPSIIIEHCFIDSYIDREILDSVGVDAIAHADAQGILDYIRSVDGVDEVSEGHSVEEDAESETYSTENRISVSHSAKESKIR